MQGMRDRDPARWPISNGPIVIHVQTCFANLEHVLDGMLFSEPTALAAGLPR